MKKKRKRFILENKLYTALKWILATAVAPTIALISDLGEIYHFDTITIVKTIAVIATFLGALIGYSNYNYKKGE